MKALGLALFACCLSAADREVTVGAKAQYSTVQAAVDAAAPHTIIHILPGVYKERVVVPYSKPFLTFRGDDPQSTVITNNSHAGLLGPKGPINTFATPTVFIQANDFTAEGVTFENNAGNVGQAVALTIMGDRGIFRNCRFLGYQDTLLAQAGRQYFERCYIEGATDFIFGGSAAFFDRCTIHVTASGYITAANTTADQRYGYVFDRAVITGAPGVKTYLGRPWRPWSATVFMNSEMSDVVRPEGWNNWNEPVRERTVRYSEYRNSGPGGTAPARVAWARQLNESEAAEYSVEKVLAGLDGWNPKTGTVQTAVKSVKGSAARPAIGAGMAWLASLPDGHLATNIGGNWSVTRVALPAPGARIVRAGDIIYALWADGRRLAISSSGDLLTWSAPQTMDVMSGKDALDLHSPNAFAEGSQFLVTWSSTIGKNAIQAFQEDVEDNPRIWYSMTRDFETFTEPQVLFDNNYAVRDAQIVKDRDRYALVHSATTGPMKNLRVAFASRAAGPWSQSTDAFTAKATAAPALIRSGDEWWIFHSGGMVRTRDFWNFSEGTMPAAIRPISVIEVPKAMAAGLQR